MYTPKVREIRIVQEGKERVRNRETGCVDPSSQVQPSSGSEALPGLQSKFKATLGNLDPVAK